MEPSTKKCKKASRHACNVCGKLFAQKEGLSRHKKSTHAGKKWYCGTCGSVFTRKDNCQRHTKSHIQTGGGNRIVQNKQKESIQQPEENIHKRGEQRHDVCEVKALGGTVTTYTIKAEGMSKFDPMAFLKSQFDDTKDVIKKAIKERGGIKWYLSMKVKMTKRNGEKVETAEPHFRGKCQTSLKFEDIDEGLRESIKKMFNSFIEYQRQGSNWTVDKVLDLTVHMARYRPLRGSSYIQLPIKLRSKHAIINIKNKDNKCFMWSILAALYPAKHDAERISKYQDYISELNFDNIEFPLRMADIPKFEKQNNISVDVFGYEKSEIFPKHLTLNRFDRHVNILMISDNKKTHFCWIKDLNRLLSDQKSNRHRHFYCPYCLQGFTKERILNDHKPYCQTTGPQKIEMPTEDDKWLYYKDIRKQLKVPYVIYADFESLLLPIEGCGNDPEKSQTTKTNKHVPCGFAYKVVGLTSEKSKQPVVYRGLDAADKFVECMVKEQEDIEQHFRNCEPMAMTGSDWQLFKKAVYCHICHKELGDDRVRDHCHVTGKFRGAAHNVCNINYKFTGRIPVIFHNLRGYDSHLIMQAIGKVNKSITCIPNNLEKYISFSLGCMDFIDSFQFLSSSLEKLVDNLAKEGLIKFKHMTNQYGEDILHLLLRKQVYPYEYFDSESRFLEKQLPPIGAFYSTLTSEGITEDEYAHAQQIWRGFSLTDLGQYHDLYVLTDVLALADVFENFRDICLNYYGLDAAHFYTSPGLAWEAALKMTGVRLELLTDIDMHLFIEKGLRGGVSMISHRHAKANNKYVPDYDPGQENSHIMYLDANNLYGWAMSQALPVDGFKWLDDSEVEELNASSIADDDVKGYILEVDLEYPTELHDYHNEYPLAPEKMKVVEDMLSPYAKTLIKDLELKGASTEKLIPNLRSKEKYVVHYRNLKLYMSLGMKMTRIHRVLTFKQEPWLKKYIDFNTEKRKQAKNEFEKDFFKLMNNSVFGKTMENLRKRTDVKLINGQLKARKLISKPTFHAFKIFNEDLVAVHMLKQRLYLNRPIYVGFSILDLSKTLMYDFHYNYMKNKYGTRSKLLFTDTDSLCYTVNTDDIYQDMMEDNHLFDTSEYNPKHPLHSTLNKKMLGKMKDETHGIPIQEFVGLKSKMYSLIYEEDKQLCEKKTAKGIKKSVIKHHTRHAHYKQCLFNKEIHMSTMTQIRSYDHQLYTICINKFGLSPYDDKRYILDDGLSSLAYGHWRI